MADEQLDGIEAGHSQASSVSWIQHSASNETVQNILELLYQDKSTVMVKAIDLLVRNVQQQQQITFLNQTIGEAVQQQEQMLIDLHDQPVIESFMANL
uniref:Uncharacterized protein n=1 Tax=Anopheles farauti TaxID=69004 RepID=A0A182QZ85_9DIPT